STGLLAILVAALLAAATIPSPMRTSGWQEMKDPSIPRLREAAIEWLGLQTNPWQRNGTRDDAAAPDVIGLIYRWLFRPMEQLEMSFW
ncbi:MAG: hypothetical protein V3U86_08175, partial [Acidobacteriota bacterium]